MVANADAKPTTCYATRNSSQMIKSDHGVTMDIKSCRCKTFLKLSAAITVLALQPHPDDSIMQIRISLTNKKD